MPLNCSSLQNLSVNHARILSVHGVFRPCLRHTDWPTVSRIASKVKPGTHSLNFASDRAISHDTSPLLKYKCVESNSAADGGMRVRPTGSANRPSGMCFTPLLLAKAARRARDRPRIAAAASKSSLSVAGTNRVASTSAMLTNPAGRSLMRLLTTLEQTQQQRMAAAPLKPYTERIASPSAINCSCGAKEHLHVRPLCVRSKPCCALS